MTWRGLYRVTRRTIIVQHGQATPYPLRKVRAGCEHGESFVRGRNYALGASRRPGRPNGWFWGRSCQVEHPLLSFSFSRSPFLFLSFSLSKEGPRTIVAREQEDEKNTRSSPAKVLSTHACTHRCTHTNACGMMMLCELLRVPRPSCNVPEESKFWYCISPAQISSYLKDQYEISRCNTIQTIVILFWR